MQDFRFIMPTALYYGTDCVKKKADIFKAAGSKAYIVTSHFSGGRVNRALNDVKTLFDGMGIQYIITEEVEENPPAESVAELTKPALEFKPDFLVAIGGGSAIDTAKGISVLVRHPGEDAYKVFYDGPQHAAATKTEGHIPVFAIPTTAGTGAEVTGYAVLTRTDLHTKASAVQRIFCEAAFLDANYVKEAPTFLIHTGAMDALAHGVESYVHTGSSPVSRSFAEMGFRLFAQFKDHLMDNCLTDEDFEKMNLAAFFQGVSLVQAGTTIPHAMGYPLSHYKGLNHGHSSSICLGEYMRNFKDKSLIEPIVEMCGFSSLDEMCDYVTKLLVPDLDMEVTVAEIEQWSQEVADNGNRLARNPEPIGYDEIYKIFYNSLSSFIVEQ